MRDDDGTTPRLRGLLPAGPRSAGLAVVLPPPAAPVVDLGARRARAAVVDLAAAERGGSATAPAPAVAAVAAARGPAQGVDESSLSIQDRVRLRALEASRA
ncbi:hypothetical protein [Quadrisphaera sp. KR29]|uniref:hypothetical protein n=1 Tax=Quadrisphaera sp. KR29 TaxID=3461391 RepID=UPI004044DA62